MQDNSNKFSMQDAMRLAQSPVGQQLLTMLQRSGGADLQNAMAQAAAGDYEQAKQVLNRLLSDPEAKQLFDQLGR